MGTTKAALVLVVVWVAVLACAPEARADSCTKRTKAGSPFAICFDVGNRLFLDGGTDGVGGGIHLRQTIGFDEEPDLTWKLEHHFVEGAVGGLNDAYTALLYEGRYLRHARDGHVVLPWGTPRKFFVPFDIGAEAQIARVRKHDAQAPLELGLVRFAGLVDLSRSAGFRKRLSIGLVAHWDMQIDEEERRVTENLVAPLSMLAANAYFESQDGLNLAELELRAGREWSSTSGWRWQGSAALTLERVLIALNDRPLSLLLEARAAEAQRSTRSELTALVGARFSLFSGKRGALAD